MKTVYLTLFCLPTVSKPLMLFLLYNFTIFVIFFFMLLTVNKFDWLIDWLKICYRRNNRFCTKDFSDRAEGSYPDSLILVLFYSKTFIIIKTIEYIGSLRYRLSKNIMPEQEQIWVQSRICLKTKQICRLFS